jgi:DNA transposition AAA+ family ATPase
METPLEIIRKLHQETNAMEGYLNPAKRKNIVETFEQVRVSSNMNQDRAAAILGCSKSVYSQIVNDKYPGDRDRYIIAMRTYLLERQAKADTPVLPFVGTSIARSIIAACQRAWAMPCIAKIIAPSGAGKTAALAEFKRMRGDRCVWVQAGQANSGVRGVVHELARSLQVQRALSADTSELVIAIRDRLAQLSDGGRTMIVGVDEATTLTPKAINVLRNLHDDPLCRVGLVLADTWRLDGELASRKGIAGGYEQLRSRFGAVYQLRPDDAISRRDVELIAESVLEQLGHTAKLSGSALTALVEMANSDGRLRNVVYRLWAVRDIYKAQNATPVYTAESLDIAAPLVGEVRRRKYDRLPGLEPEKDSIKLAQ